MNRRLWRAWVWAAIITAKCTQDRKDVVKIDRAISNAWAQIGRGTQTGIREPRQYTENVVEVYKAVAVG